MLTLIILATLSVIIGIWIFNKNNETETKTHFEEIAIPAPEVAIIPKAKKKIISKNSSKNKSLAKLEAKSNSKKYNHQ